MRRFKRTVEPELPALPENSTRINFDGAIVRVRTRIDNIPDLQTLLNRLRLVLPLLPSKARENDFQI